MKDVEQKVYAYDRNDNASTVTVYRSVSGCYSIYVNGDFFSTVEMRNEIEAEIDHIFHAYGLRTYFNS